MGKKRTAEQREHYRLAAIKRSADPRYIEKLKVACKARSQRPEYLKNMAAGVTTWCRENKARVKSIRRKTMATAEWKAAHAAGLLASIPQRSVTMRRIWADPEVARMYLKVIGTNHKPEYICARGRLHLFKSTWELEFAKWLDEQELDWIYEPCELLLSTGRSYFPDFWVRQWACYVEIKAEHRSAEKTFQAIQDGHLIMLVQGYKVMKEFMAWAR